MNYYEYHDPQEKLDIPAVSLAAENIIQNGGQVIPLLKGDKAPANIKDVYHIISSPIGKHNFDFYFKGRDVDLGLILTDDMEFIDVDEKYKPGITKAFLQAVEFGWPELYEKLVIDYTASGGCHLIYKSEVVGGPRVMARRPNTPNPLAIIERIGKANSQYIKIPPSQGYTCYQGNPLSIQTITAEQRNWLSSLAMSFNEVHVPEVKQPETQREDSPWFVFNKRNDWKYIREQLIDRGWKIVGDSPDKVIVNRPGQSTHRSSGYIYKDISILYLHTTSTEFENGKAYSPFGVYAMFYHEGNIPEACKMLASEGCGVNILEDGEFWKKHKSKIQIKYTELLNWYHAIGYRIYNKTLVQVIDNIVHICNESDMIRAFLTEVEFQIRDEMFEKVPTIFKEKGGLMSMIKELDDNFIRDTATDTWLFFRNLAIKVTATGKEPFEYKQLKGYIWKSAIVDRDFYEMEPGTCDASRFVEILGGEKKLRLQQMLGYTISKYKDPLNPRAVIFMEDINPEEEGESQGGSGKGLLFQFVRQYRKVADFDGKNFRTSDPFLYQNVVPDTAIIYIDDVEKNFRFTQLFSVLTGSLLVNKKNKAQEIVPFDNSPKIVINSNFSIGGMDMSTRRRKYEFAINKYFGEDKEPIDVFGRQFFTGWDSKEWLRFDNFISQCCQHYLAETDKKAISHITDNSHERSLISNTNRDFIEYMDGQLSQNLFDFSPVFLKRATVTNSDNSITTNAIDIKAYIHNDRNPDYYFVISKQAFLEKMGKIVHSKYISTTKLTQWLNKWANARNVIINVSYKRESSGEPCYRFISWPYSHLESQQPPPNPGTGWQPNSEWDT